MKAIGERQVPSKQRAMVYVNHTLNHIQQNLHAPSSKFSISISSVEIRPLNIHFFWSIVDFFLFTFLRCIGPVLDSEVLSLKTSRFSTIALKLELNLIQNRSNSAEYFRFFTVAFVRGIISYLFLIYVLPVLLFILSTIFSPLLTSMKNSPTKQREQSKINYFEQSSAKETEMSKE